MTRRQTSTSDVAALLADLVAIPSVNPMGRTGGAYGEEALARFVETLLRRLGLEVELTDVAPGRPNVIARAGAQRAEGRPATLLLEAHLDTVHVDTMTIPPFTPVVKDGRLYGRGSCDTKGSLAAFITGLARALERGELRHTVVLAAVADEEYRFGGAEAAVRAGLKADWGIAGEPTGLAVVRAHKGVTRWKVQTEGTAAHSAYPERGVNAIYRMSRVVQALEGHARALGASAPHPVLGVPTLSVGMIQGGQAVNIVPDRCWIEVDRRLLPGESPEQAVALAVRALEGLEGWTFDPPYLAAAGIDLPESAPAVRALATAVHAVTGAEARLEAAHYATDAGTYARGGIPTVVFGPGDIARAHTDAEYLELDQLRQAALIIERLLTEPLPHP